MKTHVYNRCANVELKNIECGMEECLPFHSYGPAIRKYCLVHYVESGKGRFEIGGNVYTVLPGQIFYIPPKVITYYEADKNDPWVYKWVGIEGREVEKYFENGGLNAENAVIDAPKELSAVIDELILKEEYEDDILGLTSVVYKFLSCLGARSEMVREFSNSDVYARKAKDYIHAYIHRKITVSELSTYLSIDRSYLTALFKKKTGLSPQQYILNAKMDIACGYLETTDYDISHIGQSVGYDDLFAFSHAFKKIKGVSPLKYRNSLKHPK